MLRLAGIDNTSNRFVAHYQRVLRRPSASEDGQVATTDARALHRDKHLARRQPRLRKLVQDRPTRTLENDRAHSGRDRDSGRRHDPGLRAQFLEIQPECLACSHSRAGGNETRGECHERCG